MLISSLLGKIFIFFITAVSCFAIFSFVVEEYIKNEGIKAIAAVTVFLLSLFAGYSVAVDSFNSLPPKSASHRSVGHTGKGCCSRHGGVCGCGSGSIKCCDGTYSPTCECGE